jgi:hypothetical protein
MNKKISSCEPGANAKTFGSVQYVVCDSVAPTRQGKHLNWGRFRFLKITVDTLRMSPQIINELFLQKRYAKSTREGRMFGNPVMTRICGVYVLMCSSIVLNCWTLLRAALYTCTCVDEPQFTSEKHSVH